MFGLSKHSRNNLDKFFDFDLLLAPAEKIVGAKIIVRFYGCKPRTSNNPMAVRNKIIWARYVPWADSIKSSFCN
jgi:hypothetical protein